MKNISFIEDWIEEGIEKGKKEGRKEGLEQGLEQGRLEMIRENIIQVLLTRFSPSAQTAKSLETQLKIIDSLPILQNLLHHVLTTETIDDLAVQVARFSGSEKN